MKRFLSAVLLFFLSAGQFLFSQATAIDKVQFFKDTSVINATMVANFGKIISQKYKIGNQYPGTFAFKVNDSIYIKEPILIVVRGHSRKDICYIPPLKLNFDYKPQSFLYPLKSLKLVSACKVTDENDQYLLKEYMVYKIYNILTDKSFNARLLNLHYEDSSGRKKTFAEHAFLLESTKEMAKRNNCIEWTKGNPKTEQTDRRQMTIVAIFEYMIGNTDWGVSVSHNTRLIQAKDDSTSRPFAVPYDFDYSGLVNTDYSIPAEALGTESVLQRVYRGFPRTQAEINEVLQIFIQQKENIYAAINQFSLFTRNSKKEITYYLDSFFDMIKDPAEVKSIFIDNARTQ
ncbi:hypothetical protein BH11BAC6_BH11BAC6_03780 [soil metagenome]